MSAVLIVEDNEMNRVLMETILDANNYQWRSLSDGEGVMAALKAGPVHLILMDLQMPGIDGFETLALVRSDPGCQDIPVVAITGNATEADRQHALEAGFNGFLKKPFRIDELLVMLRDFPPP